ncbi:cadherin-19 isoform X1 [Rattus norvegicus]|uniref:Cadherin19 n=2 Tax=Rattus norvegicus TaxID=10116 RepID=Q5NUI3_RAT|nr:cadherin-19 precursor [Rattus norvegicus]XP_017454332.1 cadherin-19 isoform X1 [Rattus norvegicus]XP_038946805.1 cadherin-19 isoform X1 [Rattus norvegicus]BAD80717.1 Cadherin19 [Rattus norvegicus]|eukprot:NP_001009448.1 cadherin-19 precursor [Rattus norvegicus]
MNHYFLKYWILMVPLIWPCLKVAETLKIEKAQRAVPSLGRAKRGWVWKQFVVPEEMDTIQHVGRLRSDLDNGNNSFQYKLLGTGDGSFSIDEKTGDIFAMQKLDREKQSLYILRAQVIDTTIGKAVEPESEFVIRVSDVNDNEPRFLDEPYEAIVPEMSPEGTFVIKVTANDADDPTSGYHARILYNLEQGQPYFSVEPTTGVIRISSKMDRELQDTYCVIIQAKDMLGQPGALSGTTTISIKLSDINDNKPIFKESFYRFTISESAPSGTTIGKIMAYDDDIGENAEMDYSIEDDESQIFDIVIDNETQEGIVILKKKVDFEHQNHYGIRVKVKNCHVDEELAPAHVNASTTYIKVQVEDEDEPPTFLLPYYIFEIPEGKPYGTMVGTVSAVDPDRRQSPMRYSLIGSKMFDINGNGTIVTTNLLDREVSAWYNLSVTATETYNVQQISSAHVYVQVLNINDHAPEFSQLYETYVCENAESGEIIQTISAIDRDESIEDHHFYFNHSVEDTNNSSFILTDNQDNTAVILSNRAGFSLKEETVFYMIILIADNGIPPLTSTNTLTIQVCDCGDSRSTETCTSKELLFIMGFKAEAIIAIVICVMVIFGFIFLILALKQRRKETLFPEKTEDFRENIFCYDDEGGGEEDSEAFDIIELRQSTVMRERKPRKSRSAEIRSLYRQSLQVGPDSAIFRKFILEKLEEANTDSSAPPFDSLQTFAYEGTGSSAGSLSSLGSSVTDQEDDFDYLNDLGPCFKRLANMFGSAVQPDN